MTLLRLKGRENSADETRIGGLIGQDGKRRKSHSAAVIVLIDDIKKKLRIFVVYSIMIKRVSRQAI